MSDIAPHEGHNPLFEPPCCQAVADDRAQAKATAERAERRRRVKRAAAATWPHLAQFAGVGVLMAGVDVLWGMGWTLLVGGAVLTVVGALREGGLI
jgi:hypothetical protein